MAQAGLDQVARVEATAEKQPTANNYLALSVEYYHAGRYQDCIHAARDALKLNPNLAEAWANMASAWHTLGNLDETIAALREEVRLKPSLPSAQSNLDAELAVKAQLARNAKR